MAEPYLKKFAMSCVSLGFNSFLEILADRLLSICKTLVCLLAFSIKLAYIQEKSFARGPCLTFLMQYDTSCPFVPTLITQYAFFQILSS